ncbi:hypothetical protein BDQ17DRAFT_1347330 [Cyathus striatus]|nr:hypothetical protein BDQ17DRAFT_1347330 [Cyathus striatus]
MSSQNPKLSIPGRLPTQRQGRRKLPSRLTALSNVPTTASAGGKPTRGPFLARRSSVSGLPGAPKTQRTSKTSQKLVVLPSDPQTRPLVSYIDEDLTLGETVEGVREYKSQAERMTKEQRKQAGFKRITAYCVAESFNMKLLTSFLKREHNVHPRVFDEALYVMYHLPLLPGYGPNANIRSSAPVQRPKGKSFLSRLSEAEENGYQGTYFPQAEADKTPGPDGYISSTSPVDTRKHHPQERDTVLPELHVSQSVEEGIEPMIASEPEPEPPTPLSEQGPRSPIPYSEPEFEVAGTETETEAPVWPKRDKGSPGVEPAQSTVVDEEVVEAVFFDYGVVVFFGFTESQERDVLEDIENAGIMKRKIVEDDWEIEECHFVHDPNIAYPRIYNDFFSMFLLILATTGSLQLRRHEALKTTGRLFKLRRDVNLVSNVLDIPELFWDEASLKELYDAVREYMEIGSRVEALNEKLGLDAIHDHLNNSAMERITWIIIWLIVVACLVEMGEVIARLVVHATLSGQTRTIINNTAATVVPVSREDALRTLERMMVVQQSS